MAASLVVTIVSIVLVLESAIRILLYNVTS